MKEVIEKDFIFICLQIMRVSLKDNVIRSVYLHWNDFEIIFIHVDCLRIEVFELVPFGRILEGRLTEIEVTLLV